MRAGGNVSGSRLLTDISLSQAKPSPDPSRVSRRKSWPRLSGIDRQDVYSRRERCGDQAEPLVRRPAMLWNAPPNAPARVAAAHRSDKVTIAPGTADDS